MRRNLTPVAVMTLLGVLASQLWPAPAHAEAVSLLDASADMSIGDGNGGYVVDPDHANGDIVSATARHTRRSVIVTAGFDALVQEESYVVFHVRVLSDSGDEWLARSWLYTTGPSYDLRDWADFDNPVECPGLTNSWDTEADTIRVKVPRSCIDGPRWVRVSVTSGHVTAEQTWFDNAKGSTYSQDPIYTKRLRRS
jgi:hypothetical protein